MDCRVQQIRGHRDQARAVRVSEADVRVSEADAPALPAARRRGCPFGALYHPPAQVGSRRSGAAARAGLSRLARRLAPSVVTDLLSRLCVAFCPSGLGGLWG